LYMHYYPAVNYLLREEKSIYAVAQGRGMQLLFKVNKEDTLAQSSLLLSDWIDRDISLEKVRMVADFLDPSTANWHTSG
jgi:hypothetical protein